MLANPNMLPPYLMHLVRLYSLDLGEYLTYCRSYNRQVSHRPVRTLTSSSTASASCSGEQYTLSHPEG